MKLKHLINDISIDFWSSKNFVSIKDIKRKFISNKNILNGVVALTLSKKFIDFSCLLLKKESEMNIYIYMVSLWEGRKNLDGQFFCFKN